MCRLNCLTLFHFEVNPHGLTCTKHDCTPACEIQIDDVHVVHGQFVLTIALLSWLLPFVHSWLECI